MTITAIIGVIAGVFKFFDQVQWFIGILQSTPEEKHEDLMLAIEKERANFKATGRPS